MIKFLTCLWYLKNPKFWKNFLYLIIVRIFLKNHDTQINYKKAKLWAKKNKSSYRKALYKVGCYGKLIRLDKKTFENGKKLAAKSKIKMGGPGHVNLIYYVVKTLKAKKIIETGVAYGWSSLAALKALSEMGRGKLYSIDMPYPMKNNEEYVGIVIQKYLKKYWHLIRKPDRTGIIDAIKIAGGDFDVCHYDSDKSWWGRKYGCNLLWKYLKINGLFICDDIQDNLFFSEFVKKKKCKFSVIEYQGKFIGLIRKT